MPDDAGAPWEKPPKLRETMQIPQKQKFKPSSSELWRRQPTNPLRFPARIYMSKIYSRSFSYLPRRRLKVSSFQRGSYLRYTQRYFPLQKNLCMHLKKTYEFSPHQRAHLSSALINMQGPRLWLTRLVMAPIGKKEWSRKWRGTCIDCMMSETGARIEVAVYTALWWHPKKKKKKQWKDAKATADFQLA